MTLVMVYGNWGSEPYGFYKTFEEALQKAQEGSKGDLTNEYVIELEPGGFDSYIFKNGIQIQGPRKEQARTTRSKRRRTGSKRTCRSARTGRFKRC